MQIRYLLIIHIKFSESAICKLETTRIYFYNFNINLYELHQILKYLN
ncbi:MAG: hypothetical protein JWR61_3617 [Ferruginibacter sp.]|nr:hypothetical protein [Ferruginibacter sp.]